MKTLETLSQLLLLGALLSGLSGAQMKTTSIGTEPRAARAVSGMKTTSIGTEPRAAEAVSELKVEYAGFTSDGMAQYLVTVRLQPAAGPDGNPASFLVRLRDEMPPVIAPVGENTERRIQADPLRPTEHTLMLSAAWFHKGPLFVEVLECRSYGLCRIEGPLQLARTGSGLTPYGAVGSGYDRVSLHADGDTSEGSIVTFRIYNAPAGYPGVLAVAPTPHEERLLGGTLLIGPSWIFPMMIPASDNATGELSFDARVLPWARGLRFYLQAAFGRVEANGTLFIRFSNAVEVAVPDDWSKPGYAGRTGSVPDEGNMCTPDNP